MSKLDPTERSTSKNGQFQNQEVCTMCGATAGDVWETEPERTVRLVVGSRFWDIPLASVGTKELTTLCDECSEGVAGLRRADVKRG